MARKSEADAEKSLAIRAAWLHYVGGLTQGDVAKRLGVPSVKAHRLIARAVADGAVKVSIEGDITECAQLEHDLCRRYKLEFCEVAPDLGQGTSHFQALASIGALFLRREIEQGRYRVIGLGHGRTLAAAVREMPQCEAKNISFVSLMGELTRHYAANPYDVIHRLFDKTGAQAYVMPVPFFAKSSDDRTVLLKQHGVHEILEMSNKSQLKIAGIGVVEEEAQIVASGMIELEEIAKIKQAGGVAEMLGHFFNMRGEIIETDLSKRMIAASLREAQKNTIVAIAGGPDKIEAVQAVLKSRYLRGLITDERTAQALMQQ